MTMTENDCKARVSDRYAGALLGVAVGDALGAPLEFLPAEAIRRKYGCIVRDMLRGGWLSVEPGEVTDDTQMTLAVAEGIAAGHSNAERYRLIGTNFLRWYATDPKDVGNTCARMLNRAAAEGFAGQPDWEAAAQELWRQTGGGTAGNGALMRAVYPALFYADPDEAAAVAVKIGRMTHYHPDSDEAVAQYVKAIRIITDSPEMDAAGAREVAVRGREALEAVRQRAGGSKKAEPSGWAVDSLLCAYDAVGSTESFEDALIFAVNLGGDADTIGAITGGLAGAVYGASAIPKRWTEALANRPNLKTVQLFAAESGAAKSQTAGGRPDALVQRLTALADLACRSPGW